MPSLPNYEVKREMQNSQVKIIGRILIIDNLIKRNKYKHQYNFSSIDKCVSFIYLFIIFVCLSVHFSIDLFKVV